MFKRNDGHLQTSMFDSSAELPQKLQERLSASWAGTFYREFFCRLDEAIFEPLYSTNPSRPNTPVNQLTAFEVLKAGQGWTDEQTYDEVCFNLQVRYALGLWEWGEMPFTLRTVYNFRRAVAEHAESAGVNLFVEAFEQVTGEQQAAFDIGTRKVRMDSTQVASNMGRLGRLGLVARVTQRMYRSLDEADQEALAERFGRYSRDAKGLTRRGHGDETRGHLVAIGDLMTWLIEELEEKYGQSEAYQTLERVYREQYMVVEEITVPRPSDQLDAGGVQSPDEAWFRSAASELDKSVEGVDHFG